MVTPTIDTAPTTVVGSLWLGVLGAPLIWAIHLQAVYALVGVAKASGHYHWLYLATLVCAALTVVCGLTSLRDWRAVRLSPDDTESSTPSGRTRFLSLIGMCGSAFFTLTILATGSAVYFFQANWD